MNVNLGPMFDKFIAGLVKSGQYQSQSEVVREGLRLLQEREDLKRLRIEELRRSIALGTEQVRRGKLVPAADVFAEIGRKSHAARRRGRT